MGKVGSCKGLRAAAASALLVTTALGTSVLVATPAFAQETRTYDIPAGPLSTVLSRFIEASGVSVVYDAPLAQNVASSGLKGSYGPAEALSRILAGTGLTYRQTGPGAFTIEPAPTAAAGTVQLGAVRVDGSTPTTAARSYGEGYDPEASDPFARMANPPTTIASKTPLTQREIPQSVSVVTQAEIQQLAARDLDDVMRRVPGIFVQKNDGERTTYLTRGFNVDNYLIDGVPTTVGLSTNVPDLTAYDRVEVLRGPSGLLSPFGSPGGTLNLVLKKPTRAFAASAELGGGSFANARGQADVSGPLNGAGSLRGRAVASASTDDTPRDGAYRRNLTAYGILEYDLSPTTVIRAGISFHRLHDRDQYDGYPAFSDYRLIGGLQHVFLGSDWARNVSTTTNPFLELEHKAGAWEFHLNANAIQYRNHTARSSISGPVDPVTGESLARSLNARSTDGQINVDAYASGPLPIPGLDTNLTVGVNYSRDVLIQKNRYVSPDDLFHFVPVDLFHYHVDQPVFSGPDLYRKTITNQYGAYANLRVKPVSWITLVGGGRFIWWKSDFRPDPANIFLNTPTTDSLNGRFVPYGGIIVDVDSHHSLYGGYSKIDQPQQARSADNKLLKPLYGEQFEIGVKGEYLDGRLNASLAAFQVTQANRAITHPTDPFGFSIPSGKARARGVEATLSGRVTPNWEVEASYTYTDTKYLDPTELATPGRFAADVAPRHMARLWTNYTLPGTLSAWSVGGGITAQTRIYTDDGIGRLVQNGYALLDARIAYAFSRRVSLTVNVTNLTNKYYYERLGFIDGGNWLGSPRRVLATLRASY